MIATDHKIYIQISSIRHKKNCKFFQLVGGKIVICANGLRKLFPNFINPDAEKKNTNFINRSWEKNYDFRQFVVKKNRLWKFLQLVSEKESQISSVRCRKKSPILPVNFIIRSLKKDRGFRESAFEKHWKFRQTSRWQKFWILSINRGKKNADFTRRSLKKFNFVNQSRKIPRNSSFGHR